MKSCTQYKASWPLEVITVAPSTSVVRQMSESLLKIVEGRPTTQASQGLSI